ncbi:hypothetical protein H9P43_008824 [Blastocladiella emersonii ATCC 22665]|nr:hypothetical protein H9P43_008824 [Blastocladiella emersonii ATCC 22665]
MKEYRLPEAEVPFFYAILAVGSATCLLCIAVSGAEIVVHVRKHSDRGGPWGKNFDYAPFLLLVSSLAATSLYLLNFYAVSRPEFPVISYFPAYSTLTTIESATLACSGTLVMLRRVKTVCIKRTRFLSAVTPVTVAMASAMFVINSAATFVHCENVYAFRSAFSEISVAPKSSAAASAGALVAPPSATSGTQSGSALSGTLSSGSSPTLAAATEKDDQRGRAQQQHRRQHLMASIRATYPILTCVYVAGWAFTFVFYGFAGAQITIVPRVSITAIMICAGVLLEAQFRRIVRTQISRGRRAGKRTVHHFEETVGGAVTMAAQSRVDEKSVP